MGSFKVMKFNDFIAFATLLGYAKWGTKWVRRDRHATPFAVRYEVPGEASRSVAGVAISAQATAWHPWHPPQAAVEHR